ncbi:hypothetical protein [Clostridium intestinale]|uniref:hypothetical protein n=1 Tax=Clostridium intestinale TaxID=36845 RepID=UPI000417F81A|nr:hypothetical protein [Clostridium intestinale]
MVRCPIVKKDIDIGECVIIVDVSERCIKETLLPGDVAKVKAWKEICKECEYHNN